ncbi:MAG: hypothetical protein JST89_24090 [Cyanobacteria bacterium SZAS-4]|nr:hypothetical protein [Cyanobacteria bacterium SZAS-4]
MRDTSNGVAASAYDMALAGGSFGGFDATAYSPSDATNLASQAKSHLSAEAFSPQSKLPEQTHNYLGVAADITNGIVNEVLNHPGQIAQTVAESAMAGYAFRLAPPVVRSAALTLGAVYAGYQFYQKAPGWVNDASTVVNAQSYSADQVAKAHVGLEKLGGGAVHLAAGGVAFSGGMYAPELYSSVKGAYSGLRSGTLSSEEVLASMKKQFEKEAKAVKWDENPAWMKPKETILSREETSKLFESLATKGSDYTFVKKPYTVTIRDGVPNEIVMDIQNKPQVVEAGKKVVQRIMPDGAKDTYPIDHETFLARWNPTGNPGEYAPKPIPTKMVLLDRDVQIAGHAGPQLGNAKDMLATDGSKFWTVQKSPLLDTYVGVDEKSQALLAALAKKA